MKVKKIHIKIKKLDDALTEAGKAFEELSEGKAVLKKICRIFQQHKRLSKGAYRKKTGTLENDKRPQAILDI